jgi:hypothetical protein
MRKGVLFFAVVIAFLLSGAAYGITGNAQVQVDTGSTATLTLSQNNILVLLGWTPVVTSASAAIGSIVARINCVACTSGAFSVTGSTKNFNGVVGQFTVAAGPPIILTPGYGTVSPWTIVNASSSGDVILGCAGNAVTGACLFNMKTMPSTDPLF